MVDRERLLREARALARLSHPNLVQLYDFGRAFDGRVGIAVRSIDELPILAVIGLLVILMISN